MRFGWVLARRGARQTFCGLGGTASPRSGLAKKAFCRRRPPAQDRGDSWPPARELAERSWAELAPRAKEHRGHRMLYGGHVLDSLVNALRGGQADRIDLLGARGRPDREPGRANLPRAPTLRPPDNSAADPAAWGIPPFFLYPAGSQLETRSCLPPQGLAMLVASPARLRPPGCAAGPSRGREVSNPRSSATSSSRRTRPPNRGSITSQTSHADRPASLRAVNTATTALPRPASVQRALASQSQ